MRSSGILGHVRGEVLLDALALPPDDRARIADALLDSLEPDDGETLTGEAWEAAWSVELERRLRDFE
jgi:putative addiction module component (TIGR02574 family)